MSKLKTKDRKGKFRIIPKEHSPVCEERIACSTAKELAFVYCKDCNTLQCYQCEQELHKEGDYFFHVRTETGSKKETETLNDRTKIVSVSEPINKKPFLKADAQSSVIQDKGAFSISPKPGQLASLPRVKPKSDSQAVGLAPQVRVRLQPSTVSGDTNTVTSSRTKTYTRTDIVHSDNTAHSAVESQPRLDTHSHTRIDSNYTHVYDNDSLSELFVTANGVSASWTGIGDNQNKENEVQLLAKVCSKCGPRCLCRTACDEQVVARKKVVKSPNPDSQLGIRISTNHYYPETDQVDTRKELYEGKTPQGLNKFQAYKENFPLNSKCHDANLAFSSQGIAAPGSVAASITEQDNASDSDCENFFSLDLTSLLNSVDSPDTAATTIPKNSSDSTMKGQPKTSKRSKKKSNSSNCTDGSGLLDIDTAHQTSAADADSLPPEYFQSSEYSDDEIISALSQSQTAVVDSSSHAQHTRIQGDVPKQSPTAFQQNENSSRSSSTKQSFLLIDESETIQIANTNDFIGLLNCGEDDVKVVSIFGNTGDGKSFTLNQVFFSGQEVFKTSADQDTCTVGVWAAYDPKMKVICVDTEGLLGVTSNQHKRMRLLLKVFAVSDVIIYRTCADRLHTDLFKFLGDASESYSKHFREELESITPLYGVRPQDLGPGLIVFHETTRTNTLDMSATGKSANTILQERSKALKCQLTSFSSISYVGVKTTSPPTDFRPLQDRVRERIADVTVRSPRSPVIVLEMLKKLNKKFNGEIYSHSPNSFPEEFFTCPVKCLACHGKCNFSMNHTSEHSHSAQCRYVHVYDNKVYICKKCYLKGRKIVVVPKTCASDDNSLLGVAKYAWSGYILECKDCGVIYKSRQHWYGNREPTAAEVQEEVRHIWPGQAAKPAGTHNAARKLLDGVKAVADTVGAYSSKPTKILSDWVADQVAPPYWVPNNEIVECHDCHEMFNDQEKKHHCRGCGKGFCDECTQYSKPVPERGWGEGPVRVCRTCYERPTGETVRGETEGDATSLRPRQFIENVQTVLGAVASVAIDYPIEMIKDSARPEYWIPDHLIKECHQCQAEFTPKLTIHHCRACGNGVCATCSTHSRQVPSKGWDRDVRVCDACYGKEGLL